MASPGLTSTFRTSPWATPSPRFGMMNSLIDAQSRNRRIRLFGFNSQVFDGLFHDCGFDLLVLHQRIERGQDDEAGIDLEEVAQRGARVAAAKAVGAERLQRLRQPA